MDRSHLLRSLLFVPGDRPDRVAKAAALAADAILIDLEDAVAPERKDLARAEVARVLSEVSFGERVVGVRINRMVTRAGLQDLLALPDWPRQPDALLLPKVESGAEVGLYDRFLSDHGLGGLPLLPIVESVRGLRLAHEIACSSPNVAGLLFGAADLSAEIGCEMAWEPLLAYRSACAAAAAEAGVPAYDVPYLKLKDPQGLESESRRVKALGFAGKTCIHPEQVETVNLAFTPTAAEVARAERIMAAVRSGGRGAIAVDGRMVDAPVIRSAEAVLRMAARSQGSAI